MDLSKIFFYNTQNLNSLNLLIRIMSKMKYIFNKLVYNLYIIFLYKKNIPSYSYLPFWYITLFNTSNNILYVSPTKAC